MAVTLPGIQPAVEIDPLFTAPAVTSDNNTVFSVGSPGSFTVTSTGVDTPLVRVTGPLPRGVQAISGTFPDGDFNGTATIDGTPTEIGVFRLTIDACNGAGCVSQAFVLEVTGAPAFTSRSAAAFGTDGAGTFGVAATGDPSPVITQTGLPPWAFLTNNGDGKASLTALPPPVGAANAYPVQLTAYNGIGAPATQTFTLRVVTAVTVTPSTAHLVPGSQPLRAFSRGFSQQLRATGRYPDGTTGDITDSVTWSSSNEGVASITPGALATAHALGTATVTAASASPLAGTAAVTVAKPLSIAVTPATIELTPNQTQQYTATGCYADPCSDAAHNFDITGNVTWSSLNSNVRVAADGLATAQTGGPGAVFADIVSTAGDVSGSADVTVTHGDVTSVEVTPGNRTVNVGTTVRYSATLVHADGTRLPSTNVTWSSADVSGTGVATIGPGGDAFGAFLDCGDICCACLRTRQSECTLVCETIENASTGRVLRDSGVILRLIEIKSRFLRVQKIDIELQAADFDFDRPGRSGALQNARDQFKSFCLSDRRVVPLDDCDASEQIDNRADDERLAQIHSQGQGLQNEIVVVTIKDYAGQAVALAPNHAAKFWIDLSAIAIVGRLRDPALEEIEVEVLPLARKTACYNLRFGIVDRAPNQMVLAVFE